MGMTSLGDRASSTEPAGNQWWAVSVGTELVKGKTLLEMMPEFIKGQFTQVTTNEFVWRLQTLIQHL